jgi:uncharacterized phage infection (PIP) family protein YhgE
MNTQLISSINDLVHSLNGLISSLTAENKAEIPLINPLNNSEGNYITIKRNVNTVKMDVNSLIKSCKNVGELNENVPEILENCNTFADINKLLKPEIFDKLNKENKFRIHKKGINGLGEEGYLYKKNGVAFYMKNKYPKGQRN